jgi:hypothetical protein
MLMAVGCLFTVLGAWLTWRHSPFYTLKSTLRTLGLTLLMLGAAAGLIVLTLRFSDGRSLPVQTTALAIAVVLCTLGLVLGISAVSTPAGARLTTQLPPNVPVVTLYRARIRPWVRKAAMVLGGFLLLMLVPGPVHYIAGVCAGIGAFLGVIMLSAAYVTARRVDRAITALQLAPWLHWRYPTATWTDWTRRLAERQARADAVVMSSAARRRTIILVTVFATLYAVYVVPAGMMVRVGCGLASGLMVLGLAFLARSQSPHAAERLARRLQGASPDTWFGHDGVFCNGEFCAWLGTDVSLLSASVEPGPPRCIEFWFEKILPGAYGGPQVTKVCKQVLIAADAAASDLEALQAALAARCPDANIRLA